MEEGGTLSCPPSFGHIKAESPYVIHIGRSHLYGILRLGQFMETESGIESSRDRGAGRKGPITSLSTEAALGDGDCRNKQPYSLLDTAHADTAREVYR